MVETCCKINIFKDSSVVSYEIDCKEKEFDWKGAWFKVCNMFFLQLTVPVFFNSSNLPCLTNHFDD